MSSRPEPGTPREYETWLRGPDGRSMLRLASWYAGDPELAEEMAQEAAVKVFKAWSDDKMRYLVLNQPGYVSAIVRNCFLDHVRANKARKREVEFDAERHSRATRGPDQDLRFAVLSLDDDERDMIILRYYEDLTTKEAGSRLGLPRWQAYRLHDKALAHLARLLGEEED